jgi:hypothetical protein
MEIVKLKSRIMKAFAFLIFVVGFNTTFGQLTPNCTDISAYVVYTAPLTQAQINSINASQQSQFPNVVKLAEPTSSYNCHNYAFVKSEGGSEFWLNTPGDDAFWNDQSYVSTTNTAQANLKVSYQGDHSAVTTSVTNQAISKWGVWGLYRHNITDVPSSYLPNSTLTYYRRKPTITGPSLICSSGTFGLQDQPTGTSISWSSSFATGLAINATTGFSTRQNNFNGQVIITATITNGCGSSNITRNVSVGNYTPLGTSSVNSNCSGNSFNVLNTSLSGICSANTPVYFTYNIADPNYSNFVFTPVSVPSGASWSGGGGNLYVTVYTPSSSGSRSATIALSATGPCGAYNVNFNSSAVNISSGWRFSMSPNPSGGQVTVSTDSESLSDNESQNLIHAIKVIDPSGTRSESFEYKGGINSTTVSLKDHQPGMYILSVFDGKTWSSKQLLIQK